MGHQELSFHSGKSVPVEKPLRVFFSTLSSCMPVLSNIDRSSHRCHSFALHARMRLYTHFCFRTCSCLSLLPPFLSSQPLSLWLLLFVFPSMCSSLLLSDTSCSLGCVLWVLQCDLFHWRVVERWHMYICACMRTRLHVYMHSWLCAWLCARSYVRLLQVSVFFSVCVCVLVCLHTSASILSSIHAFVRVSLAALSARLFDFVVSPDFCCACLSWLFR